MNAEISEIKQQPAARFKDFPFWKRATTIATLGLSTIVAACGDSTTGEPTTSTPTTIETTTTVPQTTTAPTTEATTTTTSTTVPETTTTTETPPITLPADICEATGQARFGNKLVELGLFPEELSGNPYQRGISGRLTDVYIKDEQDFQGKTEKVLYANLCVVEDSNPPYIVPVMFGRENVDSIIGVEYTNSNLLIGGSKGIGLTISQLRTVLEERLTNNSQIGVLVSYILPNPNNVPKTVQECLDIDPSKDITECELTLERLEHLPTNQKVVDMLKGKKLEQLSENESIAASKIYLFVADIPPSSS